MSDWYFNLTKKSLAGFNAISYDNIIVTYFWATLYIIPKNTYAYRKSYRLHSHHCKTGRTDTLQYSQKSQINHMVCTKTLP